MDDHQKSAFDLPDDVAERLLKEVAAEAQATCPADKPLFVAKLEILNRKTREYWAGTAG